MKHTFMVSPGLLCLLLLPLSLPLSAQDVTWEKITPAPGAPPLGMAFLERDGKGRSAFLLQRDGLLRTTDGGAVWSDCAGNAWRGERLIRVVSDDDQIQSFVYVLSEHSLQRSSDRGDHWEEMMRSPYRSFNDLFCSNRGILYTMIEDSICVRSLDHGASWKKILVQNHWLPLAFNSRDDVIQAVNSGLYLSSDRGENWAWISDRTLAPEIDFLGVDGNDDVFVGLYSGAGWHGNLYRYRTSAAVWDTLPSTYMKGTSPLSVAVENGAGTGDIVLHRYPAGDFKGKLELQRTTDFGRNWLTITPKIIFMLPSLTAFDRSGALYSAMESGIVFRSSDLGDSWSQYRSQITGFTVNPVGLYVSKSGDLFVPASESGLIRSRDDGKSWERLATGMTATPTAAVGMNERGDFFVCTTSEGMYRSTDGGATWDVPISAKTKTVRSLLILPQGRMFAGTAAGLLRSTDFGKNWNDTVPALQGNAINEMIFASSGRIYAATGDGVFRSSDLGTTWSRSVDGFFRNDIATICLAGDSAGNDILFAGTSSVGLYQSMDGGVKWTPVYSAPNNIVSLVSNSLGHVFMATSDSYVLRTRNGGRSVELLDSCLPASRISKLATDAQERVYAIVPYYGIYRTARSTTPVAREKAPRAEKPGIAIHPNPVHESGILRITGESEDDYSICLFDILGREVKGIFRAAPEAGGHEIRFQRNRLSAGVYFVRVQSGHGNAATAKMLVR